MTLFSQRDPRWKDELMGGGQKGDTIERYGCLLTCIAMLLDVTPDVVNKAFIEKGVYWTDPSTKKMTNLVEWGKIALAFPQLKFFTRARFYNNSIVKNNLPCIVEVNGKPIGGYRHWVVFIGNHKMNDPLTGTERSTAVYDAVGYAIIKRNG